MVLDDKIQGCLPTGYQMKRHKLTCLNSNIPVLIIQQLKKGKQAAELLQEVPTKEPTKLKYSC